MPELQRETIAATIDGNGVTVRVAEAGSQFFVSGPDMAPNTVEGTDPYALWLAPGRRLIVGSDAPDGDFVSDVSDGLVVIEISGPRADEVLVMACPLDPTALAHGRCAQTLFAGAKAILYHHRGALRLHVERPLAAWLLDWLRQAIGSFEGQPQ
jgi:heterotetrameric sarcosine oxidase gamma subunit